MCSVTTDCTLGRELPQSSCGKRWTTDAVSGPAVQPGLIPRRAKCASLVARTAVVSTRLGRYELNLVRRVVEELRGSISMAFQPGSGDDDAADRGKRIRDLPCADGGPLRGGSSAITSPARRLSTLTARAKSSERTDVPNPAGSTAMEVFASARRPNSIRKC